MDKKILTIEEIVRTVRPIAKKYNISEVYIFGSYARGEADTSSDVDILAVGGNGFRLTDILAFGYELSVAFGRDVDAYEIREIKIGSPFYNAVMKERVRVA